MDTCVWTQDEEYGEWGPACCDLDIKEGHPPTDNGWDYCPFCGRLLEEDHAFTDSEG